MEHKKRGLNARRLAFVDAYISSWNATKAAEMAGFSNPAKQGSRLLKDERIQETIKERIQDKSMAADEVLTRLGDQARVNIGDFFTYENTKDQNGNFTGLQISGVNYEEVRRRGHLIKKLKFTRWGPELELHDGQAALVQIGRHLKLFTDNISLGENMIKAFIGVSPDDWDEQQAENA